MYMIFLNLLTHDLARAIDFYESLGFRLEQNSSDARTASLVVNDTIVITLVTPAAFAELVQGEVGDLSAGATTLHCLSVGTFEEVDELLSKAEALGARTWVSEHESSTTRTSSFSDPEGHVWRITCMQPMHVIN